MFEETRADARGTQGGGVSTGGCSSPTGIPSDRPTPTASCPAPARWWSGRGVIAPSRGRSRPTGPRRSRPPGSVARYARRDHYASLREALCLVARPSVGARVAGDGGLRRQRAGRPGRGPSGRHRLVREESLLMLVPGLGSWFVLGTVVTDAPLVPPRTRGPHRPRPGLSELHPVPHGMPDGRLGGARVWTPAGAWPGWCSRPRSFPEEHRRALGGRDLRVRRVPGGLPDQPAGRPEGTTPAGRPRQRTVGRTCWRSSHRATRSCSGPVHGRWYVPDETPVTCGAQRAGGAGQRR